MRRLLSVSLFAVFVGPASAANDALIAAIATRSAKFPTLDASLHLKETVEKGSQRNEPGKVIPPNDRIWESDSRWTLDGEKYRYDCHYPIINGGDNSRLSMQSSFDGQMYKITISDHNAIEAGSNGRHLGDASLKPLAIHFRGIEKQSLGCDIAALRFVGKDRIVNGLACEEYECTLGSSRKQTYWFDPAREYVLVRMSNRGTKSTAGDYLIDIEYDRQDGLGLVPSKWLLTQFDRGDKIRSKTTVEVTRLATKIEDPKATFDLSFPKHSIVQDGRFQNTKYRVNDRGQLIELDVLGQPVGSSLFPLIVRIWFTRFKLWILVGAVVGIAAIIAYLGRRWLCWRASLRRPVPTAELPFV